MKFKLATAVLVGGMLSPLFPFASKAMAGEANPKVEEIIAQIEARRAEKTTAEATAAQERAKQMEERAQNGGMMRGQGGPGGQQGGGPRNRGNGANGGGNRRPGGGNNANPAPPPAPDQAK